MGYVNLIRLYHQNGRICELSSDMKELYAMSSNIKRRRWNNYGEESTLPVFMAPEHILQISIIRLCDLNIIEKHIREK